MAYQVRSPELSRKSAAALGNARLRFTLFRCEGGPARRPLGSLVAHAVEGLSCSTYRDFSRTELLCEAVALYLFLAHLPGDAVDFGLDRLQFGFGFLGVALGPARRDGRPGGHRNE